MNGTRDSSTSTRPSTGLYITAGGLVLVILIAVAGWYFLFRDTSPDGVTTTAQEELRDAAITDARGDGNDEPSTGDAGLDGTWTIDTTIGDFADFSSSFAGFRIDEELASIGAKTVVGRTPDVSGTLEIEGTTVTATDISVDMTTLTTDDSRRDGQIRRQAIETDDFPDATFSLTTPIELGALPAQGEPVEVTVTGELTVHGVTNSVEIPLTAELNSGVIVVVGEINILLSDFDIEKPRAAAVLSVEDNADMELQLFFTR